MNKLWQVVRYEYRRNVFTKGFLAVCFAIPVVMALSIGIGFLTERSKNNYDPLGYVDDSGFLYNALPVSALAGDPENSRRLVEIMSFDTLDSARQAMERNEIQAYYYLPENFNQTREVQLFYNKEPGNNATHLFWDYLQLQSVRDLPLDVAYRAVAGQTVVSRTADGTMEISNRNFLSAFIPVIIALFFYIVVMANSQMMLEAVAIEKENRTMEVIVTSITSQRLIAGKLTAILLTLLTMIFVWISVAALGIFIGGNLLGMEVLQNLTLRPQTILTLILLMIPALVIVNGLVVALGASVVEVQEGQGAAVLVAMLFYSPIALIVPLTDKPESIFAIVLSLIPFSAPFSTALRMLVIQVPWWQIATSVTTMALTAAFSIWLAQQAFRQGMLQYGKKLTIREILKGRRKNEIEEGRTL